jgi:hypothetical protein
MERFTVENSVIDSVMNKYESSLNNQFSKEYEIFQFLKNITDSDFYYLFRKIIVGLNNDDFTFQDILDFLNENRLSLNNKDLAIFVSYIEDNKKRNKINRIKTLVFNNSYGVYGNVYAKLNIIYSEIENDLLYKFADEDDSLFLDSRNFLLSPRVEYYKDQSSSYNNVREAEEDYWEIISDWKEQTETLPEFSISLAKDSFCYLIEKNYNGLTLGLPLLLSKTFRKGRYSYDESLNDFVTEIFKETFLLLSIEEVFDSLDRMVEDLVDYIDINHTNFNYRLDDIDSFFLTFFQDKISKLNQQQLSSVNLSINKQIKFYIYFMARYFNISESNSSLASLIQKNEDINEEFNNLRNAIIAIRTKLLDEGYFEEYLTK